MPVGAIVSVVGTIVGEDVAGHLDGIPEPTPSNGVGAIVELGRKGDDIIQCVRALR